MILVLSPSKTLDFESKPQIATHTQPEMLDQSELLIKELRKYTPAKLSSLMDISDKLSALNVQRYQDFHTPFNAANARQALLAFKGDVYEGVQVEDYSKADFTFAQKHLRILSGLYGLLRPLDLIQPYRLEMGTALKNTRGKDLYSFWSDRITEALNVELATQKKPVLVNLASEEYFKAVRPNVLTSDILHIAFKENQKGKLKIISFFAKKARGLMASYIIKHRIEDIQDIKRFKGDGYRFSLENSKENQWVFIR